jgi:anti-sigma regulatory factor (Ser/Thr protein kinase)
MFERTGESMIIELRDDGPEFDPTAAAPFTPSTDNNATATPGGWGIELVRRNVDDIRYRREGGTNVLRLTKWVVSAVRGD